MAALALALPARGVRRRIHAAKRAELARLEPELVRVRDDTLAGDETRQGRLADLLAYEALD